MRLLIAIKSCQRDRDQGFHQAIRETWGANLPSYVDLKFFMGGDTLKFILDEITLKCLDDYENLPYKTKAITYWFVRTHYDKIFLCDNDTYIDIPKFLKYPWQEVDYAGRFSFWPKDAKIGTTFRYDDGRGNIHDFCWAWASGGYGYFLSKKAARYISEMNPCSWAEDLSVGQVLGPMIKSGEIIGKNFEYSNESVWHISKSPEQPFIPQRIRDYHVGIRP